MKWFTVNKVIMCYNTQFLNISLTMTMTMIFIAKDQRNHSEARHIKANKSPVQYAIYRTLAKISPS